MKLTPNAAIVLEKRYLSKNEKGEVVETVEDLFRRVAQAVSQADKIYNKKADLKKTENTFYELLSSLSFLPNSPTLMNAGRKQGQLSACFVLPIGDSIGSIFETLRYTALIQKSGGGTGFNFSKIRPEKSPVSQVGGEASGPLSFIKMFDAVTDTIKQGGTRRGANMAILNITHPDILEFIHAKEKKGTFLNFNFSVAVTDQFMKWVDMGSDYSLIHPVTGEKVATLNAKKVFEEIIQAAWKTGDPGLVFIDRINEFNPTPQLGAIESTNPCGEQPLLPFESCNLGSINLNSVLDDKKKDLDWEKLQNITHEAVHFLDNIIDVNSYPLPEIEKITKANRKIGLGVMGLADILYRLKIPYNSEKALALSEKTISFIQTEAVHASENLAKERGVFPNYVGSLIEKKYKGRKLRHATLITIAPTGTISLIAGCSSGIEPIYAKSFVKNVLEGEKLPQKYDEDVVTALEIEPEWHVKMQAVFQKYCDNGVSKTVNLAHSATEEDVACTYKLAYKLRCKGITIYRDQSRDEQVLQAELYCPECGASFKHEEGCVTCPQCGYEKCFV
ncbi:MAG TPA: adenosylcobalamin-dependent ribonucleoside-diphosphate reductase [Bdellovibrionota bacterium]|nr:adenosylcobalamin-dependent ribonucleoside-diphosphate reductase [Bdellovibrionota bacterium]